MTTAKEPSTSEIKSAETMSVRVHATVCPYCGAEQDGWAADPRGLKDKCDDCNETYLVPHDVVLIVTT